MNTACMRRGVSAAAILLAAALVPSHGFAQDAKRGDLETFTFNYNRQPQHFDPQTYASSVQNTALYPIFDRLFTADNDGAVHPGLAESWDYSDDGLQFTMHLRQGVKYQDEAPFDAESVKANINRTMTVEGGTQAVLLRSVQEIKVVDDHTITLVLKDKDSTLPFVFADLAGMMLSPASFGDASTKPIGAGPFKLDEYVSGQYISYKKWDEYWDAANIHVNNLRINITPDLTTAFNSLQSGAADAAYISGNDAKMAEDMGLVVDAHPTTSQYRLWINPQKAKPFADKRVRDAVNLAIDRKAITDSLYAGYATPASQYFPQGSPYYNTSLPEFKFDPEQARKLLAEAGYPDGFSFLSGATTTDVGAYVAVQSMLADIGIKIDFRVQPSAESGSSYYGKETDAQIATWGGRLDPLATLQLTTGDTIQNPGKLTTPKFLSILDEALATTDPAKRIELIQALNAEIYEQALNIPIALPASIIAFRKGIAGMPSPTWSDRALDFRNVYATQD
ncbi:MAG: ABC transporter substrate-binding protein [Rhizobiaceae bacterium]|nr:ABC transporter substrate-binding protein [Rhizobiaceae bacterium]